MWPQTSWHGFTVLVFQRTFSLSRDPVTQKNQRTVPENRQASPWKKLSIYAPASASHGDDAEPHSLSNILWVSLTSTPTSFGGVFCIDFLTFFFEKSCYATQAGLNLLTPPSVSWRLRLQICHQPFPDTLNVTFFSSPSSVILFIVIY